MFDKVQQNLQPYMDFGAGTLPYLNALLGISSVPAAGNTNTGTTPTTTTQPAATSNAITNTNQTAPTTLNAPPGGYGKQNFNPLLPANYSSGGAFSSAPAAGTTSNPAATSTVAAPMDSSIIQAALEKIPGYQFAKKQGLKAVQNSASARGLGVSGAAQKGASEYTTGLADQTYGNQFNRFLSAATLGQNAAAGYGTNSGNAAQGIATTTQNAGQYMGAGITGAGGAIGQGLYGNSLTRPWTNPDTGERSF